jgi:hypothetical protein
MIELTQPTDRERLHGTGGLGSLFDQNHEPAGLVTVAVGPYVERLPLGNSTVAQIRARFGPRFDIDPRTQAVLDGREVGDDTVVRTGQVLMFVHKSGEKGFGKPHDPGSKHQRRFRLQTASAAGGNCSSGRRLSSEGERSLELGAWSFSGAWSLELGTSHHG